ncbi:hypothetical protein ACJ41O_007673 [Fusarium nematophilum]
MCLAVRDVLVVNSHDDVAEYTVDVETYLGYLRGQMTRDSEVAFSPLLHQDFHGDCRFSERVTWALVRVASCLQANASVTINDIIRELVDDYTLDETCRSGNANAAQHLVFCIQGWLTLLYIPSLPVEPDKCDSFKIDTRCSAGFRNEEQPISQSSRPFIEVLGVFGVFSDLGSNSFPRLESITERGGQLLFPSLLTASALTTVGGLEICWVDSISCHLALAPAKKLCLFRLPSFARLHLRDGSLLESTVQKIHDDDESLATIPFIQVADEILRSYHLLFGAERKARSLYRSKERKKARVDSLGGPDKLLDELCGYTATPFFRLPRVERPLATIDASVHFPAFAPRLLRLQKFMETRQARGLRGIYHDQRNSYQWWTFWAVIWIGGIGLLLSFVSTILTAIQTIYSVKSFYADACIA